MGKTIIKLAIFGLVIFLIYHFGGSFLQRKRAGLNEKLKEMKGFIQQFRQAKTENATKPEIVKRKPLTEEEKEVLGELPSATHQFPVMEKLKNITRSLNPKNLKNLITQFRQEKKLAEKAIEEPQTEEAKEILEAIRKAREGEIEKKGK